MTLPVFLADAAALAAARPGGTVGLDGPEGRHAVSVLRLRVGEGLDLVDGAGRRVRGAVAATRGKDGLEVAVESVRDEPAPPVRLALVQALARGGRDEQAVESAVEVGAELVVPWQAERCVSRWEGPKLVKGREKWRATVLAATKQSRRAVLPEVGEPSATAALAAWTREVCADGGAVLVLDEAASVPLRAALAASGLAGRDAAPPVLAVVVGPEGGIAAAELDRLTEAGARPARLGPHVLRTSSAGTVALAVLAERLGLWDVNGRDSGEAWA